MKPYKPQSLAWEKFEDLDGGKKIQCKLCPPDDAWESFRNATRASKHLADRHKIIVVKPESQAETVVESPVQPSPCPASQASETGFSTTTSSSSSSSCAAAAPASAERPFKKSKLSDYFDRPFTQAEQAVAERAQALYVVMNGYSYHSQVQPWSRAFFRSLRADYDSPSIYILEQHIKTHEAHVRNQVMAILKSFGVVALAVDGWTDHQNFAALAFTALVPSGRAFLLKFERIWERETGPFISKRLIAERKPLFFQAPAVLANIFHHKCRGASLDADVRSDALQKMPSLAESLNVKSPDMNELMDYMESRNQFAGVSSLSCKSFDLWSTLFPKTSLSPLGKLLSSLPCSQNSVERVFSAADWAADNRERLGFEKLALEVYVRFNWLRLSGVL